MVEFIKGSEVEGKIKSEGVTVINVTAAWCGPCQMFAPVLNELSETVSVYKVDLDSNADFVEKMGVKGVPATFIYQDKKMVKFISGYRDIKSMKEELGIDEEA